MYSFVRLHTPLLLAGALSSVAVTVPHRPSAGEEAVAGTYVGKSLNGKALPADVRLASTSGYSHWLQVDQVILGLRANGEFTVSYKYRHEHLAHGERAYATQLLDDTRRGTFSISGKTITFVSAQRRARSGAREITGSIQGDVVEVQYRVRDGDDWRTMTLRAVRDPSYW